MAAATLAPLPMFGAWNEHWKNHPAGLPVSQYKPNTNQNTGSASVDAAYSAYNQQQQAQAPATPAQTPWNGWSSDFGPGTPATPATPNGPGTPATPATPGNFASQYTPAMMDQIYENPWYILGDVFNGIKSTSPLYQSLRDIGADPLTLYNITKGAQGNISGGASDYVNWLANSYQNLGSQGGQRFDAKQLLGALFGQEKFGSDSQNTLGQILGAGDMSTQIRTLFNMARDASNVGLNPLAARGYQSALAQAGDRYGDAMLGSNGTTGPQNPAAWIKANMPWLTLGG